MSKVRLPKDPNTGVNRAPGETELATLRSLIQKNETMTQFFDLQLEEGRKQVTTIQKRYNELRKALECTLSELHAANRFVEMLKEQKAAVQNDLNRLNGLVHPIRRCNEDVLRYIFTWAVQLDVSRFWCATRISHVCRRWRSLALKTPELWTEIEISMDKDPANIKAFWDRTVKRIAAGMPPFITLQLFGADSEQEALDAFGFRKIGHLRQLDIEIHASTSARRLRFWYLEHLTVDHLSLFINVDEDEDDEDDEDNPVSMVHIPPLIRKFRNLTSLSVSGPGLSFTNHFTSPFPNITTLKISDFISLSLAQLIRHFPNVEELELQGPTYLMDGTDDLLWPTLCSLSIGDIAEIPWSHLRIPNLDALSVTDDHEDEYDQLVSFISIHPSLRHLTLLDVDIEEDLLEAISHLETLTIDHWPDSPDLPNISPNKVEDLRVRVDNEKFLTTELLESIAESRTTNATSDTMELDDTRPLAKLRIIAWYPITEDDLECLNSENITISRADETEIEIQGVVYQAYDLKLLK